MTSDSIHTDLTELSGLIPVAQHQNDDRRKFQQQKRKKKKQSELLQEDVEDLLDRSHDPADEDEELTIAPGQDDADDEPTLNLLI